MSPSSPETCWPTPEQELLLKAALLPGREALQAWRELKAKTDFGDLDSGSLRLLPLLWNNLARREGLGEDPSLEAARVSYRGTLAENTLLFHEAASTLRELRAAGCPAMLLKGLALVARYYGHRGLRPMGDFDILIPTERREEVISLLQDTGWNPMSRGREKFSRPYLEVSHAHTFSRGSGWCVDLHWHAMEECVWPGADDDFWSGSEEIAFKGVPVAVMNPADQLLHVCVHGTKWERIPTLRWVADAEAVITASGSALDWDRFADQVAKRDLVLPAGSALGYVKKLLGAPVPGSFWSGLTAFPFQDGNGVNLRGERGKGHPGSSAFFRPSGTSTRGRRKGRAFCAGPWDFLPSSGNTGAWRTGGSFFPSWRRRPPGRCVAS